MQSYPMLLYRAMRDSRDHGENPVATIGTNCAKANTAWSQMMHHGQHYTECLVPYLSFRQACSICVKQTMQSPYQNVWEKDPGSSEGKHLDRALSLRESRLVSRAINILLTVKYLQFSQWRGADTNSWPCLEDEITQTDWHLMRAHVHGVM